MIDNHESLLFREAVQSDLEAIVKMLADDELGSKRERYEDPLPECYHNAFQSIDTDPNNELIVVCEKEEIIGVLQLTYIPSLTYQGRWRATIEGVRTKSTVRGAGVGSKLIRYAIKRAEEANCLVVQLTTDKKREDALRFYEKLGFKTTHEGLKLHLN